MQPQSLNKLQSTLQSTLLHKVARKILAPRAPTTPPTRATIYSRSSSANSTSHSFPAPSASVASVAPTSRSRAGPANPSGIQRRRGAIVELPNEWYAKAEEYSAYNGVLALGPVRTSTRKGTKKRAEAERIRRAASMSFEFIQLTDAPSLPLPPPPAGAATVRSVGLSLLRGRGMRRGKSAQAALGGQPRAPPTPDEPAHERHALDWTNLSDDATISFDFEVEYELDAVFDGEV